MRKLPCRLCNSLEAKRSLGHKICDECRAKKKAARPPPKRHEPKKVRKSKKQEFVGDLTWTQEFYKLAGLNTKGGVPGVGWRNAMDGLGPDWALDEDYEFDSPERISADELKWLL